MYKRIWTSKIQTKVLNAMNIRTSADPKFSPLLCVLWFMVHKICADNRVNNLLIRDLIVSVSSNWKSGNAAISADNKITFSFPDDHIWCWKGKFALKLS